MPTSGCPPKTRHDYRVYAATYVRPHLGGRKVRDVTPEVVLTWQRHLTKEGDQDRQAARP